MGTYSKENLWTRLKSRVYTNALGLVTAAMLQEILKDFIDSFKSVFESASTSKEFTIASASFTFDETSGQYVYDQLHEFNSYNLFFELYTSDHKNYSKDNYTFEPVNTTLVRISVPAPADFTLILSK